MRQFALGKGSEQMKNTLTTAEVAKHPIVKKLRTIPSQDVCKHLKGGTLDGQGAGQFPVKDYSVYLHTFPDSSQMIKCTRCGKRWNQNEEGWDEAIKMTEQSTNYPSASEQVISKKYKIRLPDYAYFNTKKEADEAKKLVETWIL